jgi:internalin A
MCVNHAAITTLPQGFGQLLHIVHLNLSKNGLTELPEAFGKLESIRWLDLFSNNLTRLP